MGRTCLTDICGLPLRKADITPCCAHEGSLSLWLPRDQEKAECLGVFTAQILREQGDKRTTGLASGTSAEE